MSFCVGVSLCSSARSFGRVSLYTANDDIKEFLASRVRLPEHLPYVEGVSAMWGVILATTRRSLSGGGVVERKSGAWMGRLLSARACFSRLQGSLPKLKGQRYCRDMALHLKLSTVGVGRLVHDGRELRLV